MHLFVSNLFTLAQWNRNCWCIKSIHFKQLITRGVKGNITVYSVSTWRRAVFTSSFLSVLSSLHSTSVLPLPSPSPSPFPFPSPSFPFPFLSLQPNTAQHNTTQREHRLTVKTHTLKLTLPVPHFNRILYHTSSLNPFITSDNVKLLSLTHSLIHSLTHSLTHSMAHTNLQTNAPWDRASPNTSNSASTTFLAAQKLPEKRSRRGDWVVSRGSPGKTSSHASLPAADTPGEEHVRCN